MKSEFHQLMDALKFMAVVYLAVLSHPCHSGFVFDESEIQSNESISCLYGRWKNHFDVTRWSDSDPEKAERLEAFARTAVSASKLERPSLNNLADMTPQEFKRLTSCLVDHSMPESDHEPAAAFTRSDLETVTVPASVDWRKDGAVLPVSTQGTTCGACWAFSAADTIASINYIKSKKTKALEQLSVQQLVDCIWETCGCKHGNVPSAFEFTIANEGITTEANYPYKMKEGQCPKTKFLKKATINGYNMVPQDDEGALLQVVAAQPVSASIDASSDAFKNYVEGIFSGPCDEKPGHSVTIIGYGSTNDNKINYWIIKNSWSEEWGEKGYMKLAFGRCRIARRAIYPTKYWAVAY